MRGRPISRILSKGLPPLYDHSSWRAVANVPLAANPDHSGSGVPAHTGAWSLFGIAPGGACRAGPVTSPAVGSYSTVSPLPRMRGSLFSVALSLGFPRPGITRHRALWCPDFPRESRDHPAIRATRCLGPIPLWVNRPRGSGAKENRAVWGAVIGIS